MDWIADLTQAHGILSHLGKALDLGQNVTIQEICADGLMGILKKLMCFMDR